MIFVGVGSPNPLFIRQRRFRDTVGRFSSTFQCRDMNIDRQSTINSTCTVRDFQPVSVDGRGNLAPTIADGVTNVNAP